MGVWCGRVVGLVLIWLVVLDWVVYEWYLVVVVFVLCGEFDDCYYVDCVLCGDGEWCVVVD